MKTKLSVWCVFFILLFVACNSNNSSYIKLNNKNATKEAQELYSFLQESSKKVILSGQHNYPGTFSQYSDEVYSVTGKKAFVWGQDFGFTYDDKDGIIYRDSIIKEAIKKHKEGHIITLMWHAVRPIDNEPNGWKESIQNELTQDEWNDLVTPGTEIQKKWLSQLDVVAGYLKILQNNNIPVIWRPYHEMNGEWFWWGGKKGEKGYKQLYRNMYNYFTNHHKLNNLIWVWNANEVRSSDIGEYEEFFPGLDVVDILATDVYSGKYPKSEYEQLKNMAQGKPIAIGECGPLPPVEVLKDQPGWCWFMCWAGFLLEANSPEKIKEVYNYEGVRNLK